MSKNVEAENFPKNFQRDLTKMTERQKYSYTLKMSQNQTSLNDEEDEYFEDQILDYDQYFREQQKKRIEAMDKNRVAERNKLINKSLKEFKLIKKNIYMNRKRYILKDEDAYICECVKPHIKKGQDISKMAENELFGCGDRCSNQLISWDCVAHLCPCKESCRNRRFQLQQHAYVYPIKTENRGWGLCAGEFLPKGTFIMQYIGEIYNITSSYGKKKLEEYKNKNCTYLMSLSDNEVIDPTYKGNLARFINHSCDPNCLTQKWYVLGEQCIGIFTLRDINEGEELTFNYNFDIYKTTFQKCLCNSVNCRGYLGVAKNETIDRTSNSYCRFCKNNVKASDKIIACEGCSKIFHHNCTKKSKFNILVNSIKSNSNSIESPYSYNNSNYSISEVVSFFKNNFNMNINDVQLQNIFICNSCIKKKIKKDKKVNLLPISNSNPAVENSSISNQIQRSNSVNIVKTNLTSSNNKRNNKIIYDHDNDEMLVDDNFTLASNNIKEGDLANQDKAKSSLFKNESETANLNDYSRNNSISDSKQKRSSSIVLPNVLNSKNTLIRMNLEEIKEAGENPTTKTSILENLQKSFNIDNKDSAKDNVNLLFDSHAKAKGNKDNLEIGEISNEEIIDMQEDLNVNEISPLNKYILNDNQQKINLEDDKAELNNNFLIKSQSDILIRDNKSHENFKNFFKENSDIKNLNVYSSHTPLIRSNNKISLEGGKMEDDKSFNNLDNHVNLIKTATEDFFKSDDEEEDEDDNIIIDDNIEVDSKNLKIIRANLHKLSSIGARLFWDFRLTNQPRMNIKITGTKSQISKIKIDIDNIISAGNVSQGEISETFYVPKIYVRRIIGHQNRNLNTFKSKYNVDIDYDTSLITDEIFSLTELTKITIKGLEQNLGKVRQEIQNYLYNMKMISIHLMNTDYSYVKQSICNLKTSIDPADVRLRKKDPKNDREIKHSFYYIPSNSRDLVIIGFDSEVKKGQAIIRDFLLRQNTLEHNQSLCFLCPTYLMNTISNFKNDYSELLRNKNVHFKIIEPNYIRKHLNINLEGKWKDIMLVKNYLFRCFSDFYNSSAFLSFNTSHLASINFIPNKKKSSIHDFLQYTYNQEHKLISKNLRKFFIEKNYLIKNWDYISEELFLNEKYIAESKSSMTLPGAVGIGGQIKKDDFNNSFNLNNINNTPNTINSNNNPKDNQDKEDDSNNNQLKTFLKTYDRDTALNYMLNQFPGDYQRYYGMSQIDLCDHLIYYLEEANNSYNHYKKDDELERINNLNSQNNNNNNFSKLIDRDNKNDENKSLFNDPSDVLASEYEPNPSSKENKKSSIRKRRKSRSLSRGNYTREREYRDREHRDKDYYHRDRDREYKDRDYRDRDCKESQQASKNIDYEPESQFSDEVTIPNKENKSPNKTSCDIVSKYSNFDELIDKNLNNMVDENEDYFKKILAGDLNQNNNISDNSLLKKITSNQEFVNIVNPKDKSRFSPDEILNQNKMPDEISEHFTENNKSNFNSNNEIKNLNLVPININSTNKSNSFLINNNIIPDSEEENSELKNSLNTDLNGINQNNNQVDLAEVKIGNLKNIDINMDGSALDENFINKISEINKSYCNLNNTKNASVNENQNNLDLNVNNEILTNKKNLSNISNSASSAEKDSLCNENFIAQANSLSNGSNAVSQNEMMNILYNFSNINQMNINININSNYKDLLPKTGEIEKTFANTIELEFLKNLENLSFMKVFNSSLANNTNKLSNNIYTNSDVTNSNEINLNFEPADNEISLLKRKIKSSEFNSNNSSKPDTNLIIDQTSNEKKISKDMFSNMNSSNIDPAVLNLNEKLKGKDCCITNYSTVDKNIKNYENINTNRRFDLTKNSSKYEKNTDKYYDKYSFKNHDRYESNQNFVQGKRSTKNFKNGYENRRRRSSSNRSKAASASLSPENYNLKLNQNLARKESFENESDSVSDDTSSKKKENYRENSVGNCVYKRMKIKMRKESKKEKSRGLGDVRSESSSPNLSLNEDDSYSVSKKSNKSSNRKKYGNYDKPGRRNEKNLKEISNNSSSGNTNARLDNDPRSNSKFTSKVDDFVLDVKTGSNRILYDGKEESLNRLGKKFSSKQKSEYRRKKDFDSKSPLSQSRSISKNGSYPSSRSLSMEKNTYNDNTNNKNNQGNSNFSITSPNNNIYDRRRKLHSSNFQSNDNNDLQISCSNKPNYYGSSNYPSYRKYDKPDCLSKPQYYSYSNRSNYYYNKRYNQYDKDDKNYRKNYISIKYGYNKYRNKYPYETRRGYKRQRNSDDESDSSSNHISANNELLKEFINIKKSKEKVLPNIIENEEYNFNKEKPFNINCLNVSHNEYDNNLEMEQPAQIFSALRKPNFN